MSQPSFPDPLPLCLDADSDLSSFEDAVALARERLQALNDQALILSLARMFERHPALSLFHFSVLPRNPILPPNRIRLYVNGELFSNFDWDNARKHCAENLTPSLYCSDTKLCVQFDPILHAARRELVEWIQTLLNQKQQLPLSWQHQRIERPAHSKPLFEGLLSQCLSPKAFAQWQAARLMISSAAPAPDPSPTRPSRSL